MLPFKALLLATAVAAMPCPAADAPTPDQVAEVKAAVEKLGGRYLPPRKNAFDSRVPVVQAIGLTDAELKKLPPIPFAFRINLGPKATDDGLKALRAQANLRELRLNGSAVTGAGLAELAVLPVEAVEIKVAAFADADLAQIGKFASLKALDVETTAVTDAGLVALAGRDLRELTLPERARTERGLKNFLAAVESPTRLDLGGWAITDASLKMVAPLKRLEWLGLNKTPITDSALSVLDGMASLRTLNLNDTKVTAAGVGRLTGKKLDELLLPDAAKTDLGLKHYLAAVKPRETLDLFLGWDLSDAGIASIAAMPGLKRLQLGRHSLTDAGAKQLATATALEWFDPSEAKGLTPVGIKALATLPELRLLNLNAARVSTDAVKEIAKLGKLEHLYLDRTAVTDADLKLLAGLTRLQSLSLTNTAVSETGLKSLAVLPRLQRVVLYGNPNMTDAGLKAVREALPKCQILVTGDLRK